MALRRSAHAVYDTQYHLVWTPKYRKAVLQGRIAQRLAQVFGEIGLAYDITVLEMAIAADHVHLFCSFPPRLSISQAVGRLKSVSARTIFREFPEVKRQLWGGEFWEDGYFVRTVGDKLTATVIRGYIQRHNQDAPVEDLDDGQLDLF